MRTYIEPIALIKVDPLPKLRSACFEVKCIFLAIIQRMQRIIKQASLGGRRMTHMSPMFITIGDSSRNTRIMT